VRRAPCVAVVEADGLEVARQQRVQEAARPVHELRRDAHHEQHGRVAGIAEALVGDVDPGRADGGGDGVVVVHGGRHPFVVRAASAASR
jgi:hypothetical protein